MGIKFLKLLLISILLTGCASYTGEPPLNPKEVSRDILKDHGLLIFSVTQGWAGHSRVDNRSLKIKWNEFSDNKGMGWIDLNESIGIKYSQKKSLPFEKSQLIAVQLQEGNYRFEDVSVVYKGRNYFGGMEGIPTTFRITGGKVNYIGNIGFKFVMKHKAGGYRFTSADMRNKDIPVFLDNYKAFSNDDIEYSVLGNFDWDKYASRK